ncbi:inositol-phosphate phosphatase [Paxillus involutus ATCC 200175]|uniref:Inositol-1-monophosphatase n=1 Tax=Paxillus involutus ATCC 200175 TaxID=664439 RepID=A0A0C9SQV6_PAXIN|nr:inositol-phosphate phosphatase [Paxillus involutus ATCC 200175]
MSTILGPAELRSILTFTVNLARTAGTLILEGSQAIQSASDVNEKKNSVDLVTQYDVAVENLVMGEIQKAYPTFKFIGEESYSSGTHQELTDEPTFCVDPIDGTTNFIHGFPFCCISLGLIYKRRPVLGVVYNPFLEYLYTGIEGQGSYLTRGSGQPQKLPLASPKPLPSLSKAQIAIEWGSDRSVPAITDKVDSFLKLAGDSSTVPGGKMAQSLRSMGSAALNFSMVAQGGLDLYWEIGCWPWDVCAGIVIAQEAGGVVTGSHQVLASASTDFDPFKVTSDVLTGRKYLVIRSIPDTPNETGRQAQLRIAQEFYATVNDSQPK